MTAAPEKIHGWQWSPLSIARHFGGIRAHGAEYRIDRDDVLEPLVRVDVLRRIVWERQQATKAKRLARKRARDTAQGRLL